MWSQQVSPSPAVPQAQRQRTAFYVAVGGAVLCLIGVNMDFVKGTNSYSGLSQTVKGTDEFGVGWWPVVFALLAVAALFVAQRRPDLSATAVGGVATGFGALCLLYVFYRNMDVNDETDKLTGGVVTLDNGMGYYVLLLGGVCVVVGALWFTVLAKGSKRGGGQFGAGPGGGYPTGYYGQQQVPPQGYPQPQPQTFPQPAVPPTMVPQAPAPPRAPQQPGAVYPGQAPPPAH